MLMTQNKQLNKFNHNSQNVSVDTISENIE